MTVATKQLGLALATTAGTWYTAYTCPTGYRTIVKDIRAWNPGTGDPRFFVAVTIAGTRRQIALTRPAAQPDSFIVGAFIVLNAGDTIDFKPVLTDAGNVVLVSGAELVLP